MDDAHDAAPEVGGFRGLALRPFGLDLRRLDLRARLLGAAREFGIRPPACVRAQPR